jgi:hypothetical protein
VVSWWSRLSTKLSVELPKTLGLSRHCLLRCYLLLALRDGQLAILLHSVVYDLEHLSRGPTCAKANPSMQLSSRFRKDKIVEQSRSYSLDLACRFAERVFGRRDEHQQPEQPTEYRPRYAHPKPAVPLGID